MLLLNNSRSGVPLEGLVGTNRGKVNRGDLQMLDPRQARQIVQRSDALMQILPSLQPIADFDLLYPVLLDPTEIWALCSEVSVAQFIPELEHPLLSYSWYEFSEMHLASGTFQNYLGFDDMGGDCPETYKDDGDPKSVDIKSLGVYKSLAERAIIHANAVMSTYGGGTNRVAGVANPVNTLPGTQYGGYNINLSTVRDLKAKEARKGAALLVNGEDWLLVNGDETANPLVFDGLVTQITEANGAYVNSAAPSGTFSAIEFDRFLGEMCIPPDHIFGPPQAIQELQAAYFQLGFQGSQAISFNDGGRIVPGYNFASKLNTGIGTVTLVADRNFPRTNMGGSKFFSALYPVRMHWEGENLIERRTQVPLQLKNLADGCASIQFMIWKATALVIKAMCAQAKYTATFSGNISTSNCTSIGTNV